MVHTRTKRRLHELENGRQQIEMGFAGVCKNTFEEFSVIRTLKIV